jgi:hypothetical protein
MAREFTKLVKVIKFSGEKAAATATVELSLHRVELEIVLFLSCLLLIPTVNCLRARVKLYMLLTLWLSPWFVNYQSPVSIIFLASVANMVQNPSRTSWHLLHLIPLTFVLLLGAWTFQINPGLSRITDERASTQWGVRDLSGSRSRSVNLIVPATSKQDYS